MLNSVLQLFDDNPSVSSCFPGNEIPEWFSHQSEKSLITIKLTPDWHEKNLIGFALSAIVAFEDSYFEDKSIGLRCEVSFKTNNGESHKFHYDFQDFWNASQLKDQLTILNSDHVFMWYKYENYRNDLDAVEISFEFLIGEYDHKFFVGDNDHVADIINSCNDKFRKCGVRLLYLEDVKEFDIDSTQYPFEEEDIFYDAEPGGNETIESDTEEPHQPHPMRTILSINYR